MKGKPMPAPKVTETITYQLHDFTSDADGLTDAIIRAFESANVSLTDPKIVTLNYDGPHEGDPYTSPRRQSLTVTMKGN